MRLLICAETPDGRQWAAKRIEWPRGCTAYPIRLGVELMFYALAAHNKVPMPDARILTVRGERCWGMEILGTRLQIGDRDQDIPEAKWEQVRQGLANSAGERALFLCASFIDVFLLNDDRTEPNVLAQTSGSCLLLSYIDHEQSLGWKNDLHIPARSKIASPAEELAQVTTRCLKFGRKYQWARAVSTPEERRAVFAAIELEPALLDIARPWIPEGWFPDQEFDERKAGLTRW